MGAAIGCGSAQRDEGLPSLSYRGRNQGSGQPRLSEHRCGSSARSLQWAALRAPRALEADGYAELARGSPPCLISLDLGARGQPRQGGADTSAMLREGEPKSRAGGRYPSLQEHGGLSPIPTHPSLRIHRHSLLGGQWLPRSQGPAGEPRSGWGSEPCRGHTLLQTAEGEGAEAGCWSSLLRGLAAGSAQLKVCPAHRGRWFTRRSGEGREGWGRGVVSTYDSRVCVTLSLCQQLRPALQGGPEPGQQEG